MALCEYCGDPFSKNSHNQKYCSEEHCRLATNERIMEKYYENKAIRQGKRRVCKTNGCETVLSRYNSDKNCSVHSRKDVSTAGLVEMLM